MSNGEVKRTRLNRLLRGTPQKRELNASSATYEVNGKDSNVSVNMRFTGLVLLCLHELKALICHGLCSISLAIRCLESPLNHCKSHLSALALS